MSHSVSSLDQVNWLPQFWQQQAPSSEPRPKELKPEHSSDKRMRTLLHLLQINNNELFLLRKTEKEISSHLESKQNTRKLTEQSLQRLLIYEQQHRLSNEYSQLSSQRKQELLLQINELKKQEEQLSSLHIIREQMQQQKQEKDLLLQEIQRQEEQLSSLHTIQEQMQQQKQERELLLQEIQRQKEQLNVLAQLLTQSQQNLSNNAFQFPVPNSNLHSRVTNLTNKSLLTKFFFPTGSKIIGLITFYASYCLAEVSLTYSAFLGLGVYGILK